MTKRLLQMFEENIFPFHDSCWLEKVGNQFVYLVALLAMAPRGVKKEPKDKTGADDLRKQQANMVTQLAKSTDPNKQGVLAAYKALPRFSDQKKELLSLWAKDKSCKWHSSWKKTVLSDEKETVSQRLGFGTRFSLAELLEMPPDSKEFKAVEKSLEEQGLCDDEWDEGDVTQKAYKLAKLKRWDLSRVQNTWSKLENSQGWQEQVAVEKSGKEVDRQLSNVLGSLGNSTAAGSSQDNNLGQEQLFDQFQGCLTQLNATKTGWEKEVAKAQDLAARLEVKTNQALKDKGTELEKWVQNELKEIKMLRSYLAAGEDLEPKDFNGQSMLDAAKAWVNNTQEYHTKAKAKVKLCNALL